MTIIDISVPLHADMLRYPSLKPFRHEYLRDYPRGGDMCLSACEMVMHVGTHLDAPYHYIQAGNRIQDLPLDLFIGPCQVIAVPTTVIDAEVVARRPIAAKRVLFKTPFSKNLRMDTPGEAGYFTSDACRILVERGVELLGIDSYSVDRVGDKEKPCHKMLLGAGLALLEGVCLADVAEGTYTLFCPPLNIRDAEGAPCRAILVDTRGGGI